MGTSGTSSIAGRLLDLSLLMTLFVALCAVSLGVVTGNPGTLLGMRAWTTGGELGARIGEVMLNGEVVRIKT